MPIDVKQLREAQEYYRQWNEAKLVDKAKYAGELSPHEGWRQYVSLWEFAMRSSEGPGLTAQRLRMEEWAAYYEKIRKFEAWRGERAEGT